jgi:hypothetical protein
MVQWMVILLPIYSFISLVFDKVKLNKPAGSCVDVRGFVVWTAFVVAVISVKTNVNH